MTKENRINDKFLDLGLKLPDVLLPKQGIDLEKWAVVACDQYTSQPEYWHKVEAAVDGLPSTLHMIYPEVYLEEPEDQVISRIHSINNTMSSYLNDGILSCLSEGPVLVDRKTSHAPSRKGLMICVDLEKYDYSKGSQSLIRATEGTVLERIPPRVRIRENACLELPHIMLLIDDPEKSVIEPIARKVAELRTVSQDISSSNIKKLYDFELMMDGGHISGYHIMDTQLLAAAAQALEKLAEPKEFKKKYDLSDNESGVLLYAVGDGNHSLATAKACWENIKKNLINNASNEDILLNHPARYALVELVNVHDEGLEFEPIHRVVFNVENPSDMIAEMSKFYSSVQKHPDSTEHGSRQHTISYVTAEGVGSVFVNNPVSNLEVGTLQSFLDYYANLNPNIKVDYIHGRDVVEQLGAKPNNIGFFLPSMNKNDLFRTVILDGALPRKTFSMGEAEEKRFYLECRRISIG